MVFTPDPPRTGLPLCDKKKTEAKTVGAAYVEVPRHHNKKTRYTLQRCIGTRDKRTFFRKQDLVHGGDV